MKYEARTVNKCSGKFMCHSTNTFYECKRKSPKIVRVGVGLEKCFLKSSTYFTEDRTESNCFSGGWGSVPVFLMNHIATYAFSGGHDPSPPIWIRPWKLYNFNYLQFLVQVSNQASAS